jgi:hypothetical protein
MQLRVRMDNKKFLMSIGTAIAASKIAKTVSGIGFDDVLGTVGLSRRRNHFLENLGLVAAGAIVGAGAAMLFAPSSGEETRRRLSAGASKLGQKAMEAAREQKDEALRSLSQVANGAVSTSNEHR